MMKFTLRSLLSLIAILFLTACGGATPFQNWIPDLLNKEYEPLDDGFSSSSLPGTNASPSAQKVFVPGGMSGGVSNEISDSVEIFDLGMPNVAPRSMSNVMANSMQPQAPMADANYGQMAFAQPMAIPGNDSSVTIYSLDGGGMGNNAMGNNAMGMGGMVPNASMQAYNNNSGNFSGSIGGGNASSQIFFKHGSSRLGSGDMNKISQMAEQAKFAPVRYITVEGHASKPTQAGSNTTEAHIINLRQSLKRSEKVSKALMHKGVPGEKIKTVGWGTSKATGNETQDRRVDVVMGER